MNDFLYLIDRILYRGFYAWLKELKMDSSMSADRRKASLALPIEQKGISFLNVLYQEMESAYNDCERTYLAHEALNVLEQKLERTALQICEHNSEVELIRAYHQSSLGVHTHAADRMIALHLVKEQLIFLYLKVQERYIKYLLRNFLSLEDIHWRFFRESVPVVSVPVRVQSCKAPFYEKAIVGDQTNVHEQIISPGEMEHENMAVYNVAEDAEVTYKERRFEPVMGDTRQVVKGVLSYTDIVAHKSKFAQLEVELFSYELLDTKYRFKRKPHGNVIKMAAVYWVAFQKGYFAKHYFKNKRKIPVTPNDVRLFLNHRFETNIEKQFRSFKDEKVLNDYLENEVWISLMGR